MTAPLAHRRVLITRAADQAAALARALQALGATTEELATLRIAPPADRAPLDAALHDLSAARWWVFTSANGVHATDARLRDLGLSWPQMPVLAAVGPATAAALALVAGRAPTVVPEKHDGEALASALLAAGATAGDRVLLPRGNLATPELPAALRAAGLDVREVEAYRTEAAPFDGTALARRLAAGEFDWVTFTSGSALAGLLGALPDREALARARLASIGPRTSAALREAGFEVAAEAAEATAAGLAAAIATHVQGSRQST